MQRLIILSRRTSSNITLTVYDTKRYVQNFIAFDRRCLYLAAAMDDGIMKILQAASRGLKRSWLFLKPPMTIKEAKKKGLRYLILIVIFYLIRDTILYIILPLTACQAIF
jgi:hypothetical protein